MYVKYVPQRGGNIQYKGKLYQRGHGFFSNIARYAIPLIKRATPYIARKALSSAKKLARHIADGDSFKSALKRTAGEAGREILTDISGGGGGRRRKKLRAHDVFDRIKAQHQH